MVNIPNDMVYVIVETSHSKVMNSAKCKTYSVWTGSIESKLHSYSTVLLYWTKIYRFYAIDYPIFTDLAKVWQCSLFICSVMSHIYSETNDFCATQFFDCLFIILYYLSLFLVYVYCTYTIQCLFYMSVFLFNWIFMHVDITVDVNIYRWNFKWNART